MWRRELLDLYYQVKPVISIGLFILAIALIIKLVDYIDHAK